MALSLCCGNFLTCEPHPHWSVNAADLYAGQTQTIPGSAGFTGCPLKNFPRNLEITQHREDDWTPDDESQSQTSTTRFSSFHVTRTGNCCSVMQQHGPPSGGKTKPSRGAGHSVSGSQTSQTGSAQTDVRDSVLLVTSDLHCLQDTSPTSTGESSKSVRETFTVL